MDLAPTFYQIFAGYERGHGQYLLEETATPNARGKLEGRGVTRATPATVELFERHLAGSYALGVTPIRSDNTCVFGALDVDDYPLDHLELAARVKAAGLPLICCRTKSGGAHLYCFTKRPVPARLMREKLREWAEVLGYGTAYRKKHRRDLEIFPKQDEILSDDDRGSWINLPYFDAERTMRAAYGTRSLTPEEFIAFWQSVAVADADALKEIRALETGPLEGWADDEHPDLPGAPPCLITLANAGVPSGARNNAMFSYGVYFKKRLKDGEWQEALRAFAAKHLESQGARDVEATIKSVARRDYGYKCKDTPICEVCDKKVCKTREFGVGGGERGVSIDQLDLTFGRMTKVLTKPVIWLWEVDKEIIDFETQDLMNQRLFQGRLIEAVDKWPAAVKPKEWRTFIQGNVAAAEIMEVPDDATAAGQLWDFLVRFCTSRVAGRNLDELLLGKPFTDDERSYFVASDFVGYLIQHRFPNRVNERVIYLALRDRGLTHHRSTLKGKTLSYWAVPALRAETQKEEHAVPAARAEEPM